MEEGSSPRDVEDWRRQAEVRKPFQRYGFRWRVCLSKGGDAAWFDAVFQPVPVRERKGWSAAHSGGVVPASGTGTAHPGGVLSRDRAASDGNRTSHDRDPL